MNSLRHKVEALLFVADSPITMDELVQTTGATALELDAELHALAEDCRENRGVHLIRIAGGWQFCTKPEYAELIANFLKPQRNKLTRVQLEVLAIVAYRQPITAAEIEAIRGVQSDHGLRGLLDRRLIQEVGRKQTPGRPVLYGTTPQFLHAFGLESIGSLPKVAVAVESAGQPA